SAVTQGVAHGGVCDQGLQRLLELSYVAGAIADSAAGDHVRQVADLGVDAHTAGRHVLEDLQGREVEVGAGPVGSGRDVDGPDVALELAGDDHDEPGGPERRLFATEPSVYIAEVPVARRLEHDGSVDLEEVGHAGLGAQRSGPTRLE